MGSRSDRERRTGRFGLRIQCLRPSPSLEPTGFWVKTSPPLTPGSFFFWMTSSGPKVRGSCFEKHDCFESLGLL